jgi:hypothetical protein
VFLGWPMIRETASLTDESNPAEDQPWLILCRELKRQVSQQRRISVLDDEEVLVSQLQIFADRGKCHTSTRAGPVGRLCLV